MNNSFLDTRNHHCPNLTSLGIDIYSTWDQIAPAGRFRHLGSESFISNVMQASGVLAGAWAKLVRERYA